MIADGTTTGLTDIGGNRYATCKLGGKGGEALCVRMPTRPSEVITDAAKYGIRISDSATVP